MAANALAARVSNAIERLGLTHEEVGSIVDASARSVARWTTGQVVPQRLNKQRLIELAYVADAVTEVLPRDQANVWNYPVDGNVLPIYRCAPGTPVGGGSTQIRRQVEPAFTVLRNLSRQLCPSMHGRSRTECADRLDNRRQAA
jgi:hypothetical protein